MFISFDIHDSNFLSFFFFLNNNCSECKIQFKLHDVNCEQKFNFFFFFFLKLLKLLYFIEIWDLYMVIQKQDNCMGKKNLCLWQKENFFCWCFERVKTFAHIASIFLNYKRKRRLAMVTHNIKLSTIINHEWENKKMSVL